MVRFTSRQREALSGTLRDLANTAKVDKAVVETRRKELAAAHDVLVEKRNAAQAAASRASIS